MRAGDYRGERIGIRAQRHRQKTAGVVVSRHRAHFLRAAADLAIVVRPHVRLPPQSLIMYTLTIGVPFRRLDEHRCEVASDWAKSLYLLRDSFGGRFGPIMVAAP